ncbi:hypothetical protein I5Q34_09160 [Streptomyces sp. AV19]|uniref:DUF6777 domain-containing protein n=1 Tax=Streptomyces sp. AV19 TaxID=2793068 RepID=UPI0018FE4D12|nr:DUF6777 domain-containing protein [Streptomyces sp. AV19]MBH1934455.1 hypothetical protein [Streptomyces sp. AV19]MDG4533245.1 hypothetical protein [Streptomyces sp. AV19]
MRSKPVPPDAAWRRRRAVVWLTVPALAAAGLTACSSSSDGSGEGTGSGNGVRTVKLEAVGNPGEAPFLKAPDSDVRGLSSAGGGGRTDAGAPGAFGGTRQVTRCDKAQLLKELASDAAKATAWAAARGIAGQDIQRHVTGLTAVVLLHDTLVTNHNYVGGGRTRSYHSVLQAGVAVLVDAYGKPAVKCNCGNPLRQPDSEVNAEQARYEGTRWEGFAAAVVTVVQPRPESQGPMKRIPLADVQERGKAFEREVGDDGKRDSKPVPMPTPSAKSPTPGASSPGTSSPRPTPTKPVPSGPSPTPTSSSPKSSSPTSAGSSRPAPTGSRSPSPTTGRHTPSPRPPTGGAPTGHAPSSGSRTVRPGTTVPEPTRPAPAPTASRRPVDTAPPEPTRATRPPAVSRPPVTTHAPTYQAPRPPSQQPPHTPSEQRQPHTERGERTGEHPSNPQRPPGT